MIPNSLPSQWQIKKLGEVCLEKEGLRRGPFGSAIKKDFFVPTGYKVYEQSNAIYSDVKRGNYYIDDNKYNELKAFNVIPNDILVSCSGTLGRIFQIPKNAEPGIINQALLRIRLKNILNNNFFILYFKSEEFQRKILVQSQGTAMLNLIGIKDLRELQFPLPPLPEQEAIVAKIESLFTELEAGKSALLAAREQIKLYRQSLLKAAFEGKLTEKSKKPLETGQLPEGWKWVKLGEVCENFDGKRVPLSKEVRSKRKGEFRYYGATEIVDYIDNYIFDGEYLLIGEDGANLISKSKPLAFIVKGKFWVNNHAHVLKSKQNLVLNFLEHYFNSLNITQYTTGSAQPKLTQANLNKIELPLPPLPTQEKIVLILEEKLGECDALDATIEKSLTDAELLRQSILKEAFEGRLVKKINKK